MPKLFTNENRRPVFTSEIPTEPQKVCTISYEQYASQRQLNAQFDSDELNKLTTDFQKMIIDPIETSHPEIKMGNYFVIPVSEIEAMLSVPGEKPDYIHICNGLRRTQNGQNTEIDFPVVILVPVKKIKDMESGNEYHELCKSNNSVYCEAYPCPPDDRCPKTFDTQSLVFTKEILNIDVQKNKFNSLL